MRWPESCASSPATAAWGNRRCSTRWIVGLELATNSVRHTTTSSALYHLSNGGMVIDTPGVREFGLWNVSAADVRRYYRDFANLLRAFSHCSHINEPDCAVEDAVESGTIAAARYESYRRIVESL
jgi:ribosome biogenesis GTPase